MCRSSCRSPAIGFTYIDIEIFTVLFIAELTSLAIANIRRGKWLENPVTRLEMHIGRGRVVVMTKTLIRHFAVAALLMAPVEALAQANYPEKPIHLIVGFPAGSSVDTVARLIAPKLAESLGKPVVIENVLGAAGNIASDRVVKAAPDGHTLALAANGQIIMNPTLYRLPYDTASAFAPISQIVASPNLLVVSNTSRVKTFRDVLASAKAQPSVLTYATGGVGSSPHMAGALLNSVAGL